MFKLSARNVVASLVLLGLILLGVQALKNFRQESAGVTAPLATQPAAKPNFNTMYSAGAAPDRRAFSAAEEAYSVALWRVHDKVKTSSVQLSFAGLSYKLKELDRAGVKAKIAPQIDIYRDALQGIDRLSVPDSLKELHQTYKKAVTLYADASTEMVKIADDGNEQHLLDAHSKTAQAATLLLKVSAELWPGEFKPN